MNFLWQRLELDDIPLKISVKISKNSPSPGLKNPMICSSPENDEGNLGIARIQNYFKYFIDNKLVSKEIT